MSENQPSEHDRQQRLAELQARLQRLTEERKAELRQSGPLPGDVSPPSDEDEAPEQTVDTPRPSVPPTPAAPPPEPQASAPAPTDPLPVLETPPPMEAPIDQPVAASAPSEPERPTWLTGMPAAEEAPAEATPAEPAAAEVTPAKLAAAEPLPAQPAATTAPVARTRRPSAVSVATSALAARLAMLAGEANRAAHGLRRQATAKAKALVSKRPPRRPRAQPRPDAPAASEEPAERPARKRPWLRAAVLVGVGLSGGIALMQFGDFELPQLLKGTLPAAERDDAGSRLANAVGSALPVEMDAGPMTSQLLVGGSALDEAAGSGEIAPAETAPAETRPAPPELEISSPDAPDVDALEVDIALLEPATSGPIPITSSSALPATGDPTQRPSFIPYDVPPKLENPSEIQRLLERVYPSQMRDASIEGTVILWIFVDEQGAVQKMEVKESSGYEAMDEAALSTAEKMRFTPAMNRDKATPVWLAQPITFR